MSDPFVRLQEMTRPTRYLVRMAIFLVAVIMVCAALAQQLLVILEANYALNGLILFVGFLGIIYITHQVWMMGRNVDWIEAYMQNRSGAHVIVPPAMLAPMAAMLREGSTKRMSLSASSTRSILDSVSSRLDEGREIARYMIGLLIFLGLLGTFWGLLDTIAAVVDVIGTLKIGSGDIAAVFDDLKAGLEAPLRGMSTAFASSLLGLASSLVLGFLDIQLGQAQNRFYNDLEEWLSGQTKLSAGGALGDSEHDQSIPAYMGAVLEQTAESLNSLQRTISASGDGQGASNAALHALSDQISALTDSVTNQQATLMRFVEQNIEQSAGIDEATRNHIRNLDVYVMRMLEENASGRNEMLSDLRAELKTMSRMLGHVLVDRK